MVLKHTQPPAYVKDITPPSQKRVRTIRRSLAGMYLSWELWSARYFCQRGGEQRGCSPARLRPLRLATDVPRVKSEWMV